MFQFNLNSQLDLSHLNLHQDRIPVAFAMVLDQKLESLIISVFADKPPGTFWDEAKEPKSTKVLRMEYND
jgi:hypothetical protein